jgi:hypothetical protein
LLAIERDPEACGDCSRIERRSIGGFVKVESASS